MVVWTFLEVVPLRFTGTRHSFKKIQIQERDTLTHLDILGTVVTVLLFFHVLQLRLEVWNYSASALDTFLSVGSRVVDRL